MTTNIPLTIYPEVEYSRDLEGQLRVDSVKLGGVDITNKLDEVDMENLVDGVRRAEEEQ